MKPTTMSRSPQNKHKNPRNLNLIKTRFAFRFLRALKNLRKNSRSVNSIDQIHRRSNRLKMAAYASMASAVGSRRAWSRAILRKVIKNNRTRINHRGKYLTAAAMTKERPMIGKRIHAVIRRKRRNPNPKKDDKEEFGRSGLGLEGKLRKLVPGGQAMDTCSLLEETADYVKCLVTQVDVMRKILDLYSS